MLASKLHDLRFTRGDQLTSLSQPSALSHKYGDVRFVLFHLHPSSRLYHLVWVSFEK
jgi:hypothetical protein